MGRYKKNTLNSQRKKIVVHGGTNYERRALGNFSPDDRRKSREEKIGRLEAEIVVEESVQKAIHQQKSSEQQFRAQ